MILPVIGEFISGFLAHHPLLDPLFTSPMLLPVFPCTIKRTGRIAHVLQALISIA
ncbi:MAG: hypothetical protein NTV01_00465 [Bacteroidia bacterium]|nr:hypothetical protein [Bacteroidia bacterium]